MITTSNPPIPNTQFSSYMDLYALKKHVVAFNADKLKNVVGYQLKRPKLDVASLREVVESFRKDNLWPNYEDTV